MAISIVVPQLGESVAEGTVARWLKAVGDKVRKEEPLVEIQTDKINVEIPSPAEGTLTGITVAEGTTVLVGTEIGTIGAAEGAAAAAAPASAPAPAPASTAPAASVRPSAPAAAPAAAPVAASAGGNGHAEGAGIGHLDDRSLSPAVRRLMRENEVSVAEVRAIRGSGAAGRVTRDDLLEYVRHRGAAPAVAAATTLALPAPVAAPAGPLPEFLRPSSAPGPGSAGYAAGPREETIPFTRVRRVIAENMVKAKHTAAHTHCFDEVDMSAIVALRAEWAPKLAAQGVKLTYMPFFIKAAVLALKEHPWMNGAVSPAGDAMIVKHYYNIGMAVGRADKGLIVPNIKDCDRKNLVQIAGEVNDIAARARADRLTMDEIQGGTFSISNAGVFGAINSAPVINVPDVAILGVHKIVERPVIRRGAIVAAPMMNTVIGFDHRVVDGELAVKFLRRVCELLEKPELLWFYA
ncbi:MAG TPA: dihydrolipoamide acetyltransferase family protein [Candidatus Acidoferrales bacterium]|nr:dihydrolipoamide acetyltransferase family protein [Candidatus Acidoferrales bacterium]